MRVLALLGALLISADVAAQQSFDTVPRAQTADPDDRLIAEASRIPSRVTDLTKRIEMARTARSPEPAAWVELEGAVAQAKDALRAAAEPGESTGAEQVAAVEARIRAAGRAFAEDRSAKLRRRRREVSSRIERLVESLVLVANAREPARRRELAEAALDAVRPRPLQASPAAPEQVYSIRARLPGDEATPSEAPR